MGILNACTEQWLLLKRFPFVYIVATILPVFALAYRSLCLRLIERTGLRPSFLKERYSFLPLVYCGLAASAIMSPTFAKNENPLLELFLFIGLVCAVHVPMFAAGRSKIVKFVTSSGIVANKGAPDFSWGFFATAIAILGTPLVLTLIVQAVEHNDYRLFLVDAVMTIIILSLLVICRLGQFRE
jgi:hypothetical protein